MTILAGLDETGSLVAQAVERARAAEFLRTLAANPVGAQRLASLLSQWGDQAPTLPAGAIWGLANAGIGPTHPLGQQVIQDGLGVAPAMSRYQLRVASTTHPTPLGPEGPQGPEQLPPEGVMGEPDSFTAGGAAKPHGEGLLGRVTGDIGHVASDVGGAVGAAASGIQRDVINPANKLFYQGESTATGGAMKPQDAEESGFGNAEAMKSATREMGAVATSASQVVKTPLAVVGSGVSTLRGNPEGETVSGPFGTQFHFGSLKQAVDPGQLELVQQLRGKSLGQGILPGGPAAQAATEAQQAAGNINGHALTYGRALASVVAQPDTRLYHVVSGITDFGVAMELDPTAAVAKSVSDSLAASTLFADTSDAARGAATDLLIDNAHTSEQMTGLREWAGVSSVDDLRGAVIDKIRQDPSSLSTVAQRLDLATPRQILKAVKAPQTGVYVGLRPFVHRDSVLSFASSEEGQKWYQHIADTNSFSALRDQMGKDVPVDVIARAAEATTPEQVAQIVKDEMGVSIAGPDFKWVRPWQDTRLASMLPKGFADLEDSNQAVDMLERHLAAANVPRAQWDPVLSKLATARTDAEAFDAYVNDGGELIAQRLAAGTRGRPGLPLPEARKLARFFPETWQQDHMYNVDATGQTPRVAGLTADGEAVPLSGPHIENEVGRYVPSIDPRALRQATTQWRQAIRLWHDGHVTTSEGLAGGASRVAHQAAMAETFVAGQITGLFKLGVLSAIRLPLRFLGDEQGAAAVGGIDSLFRNPLSAMGYIAGAKEGGLADALTKIPGVEAKATTDILGTPWEQMLGDEASHYTRMLGRSAGASPSPWSVEQQLLKEYVHYGKDAPENYLRGWTDELSALHLSAPGREVARAILDPENYAPAGVASGMTGMDAVKEWAAHGAGQRYVNELATGHSTDPNSYIEMLRSGQLTPQEWIDSIKDRVMVKTGGDTKLLNAVGYNKDPLTGDVPFDFTKANQPLSKSVSHEFRSYLKSNMTDKGPQVVKARSAVSTAQHARLLDWAGQKMLGALMDFPSRIITRSPAGRQFYYQEIQRMLGTLTPDAQELALRNAAEDGMGLLPAAGTGAASLEHVDLIAKARALAKMHDYLYYPGENNTAEDMLRNVMPFAGAWHSVIKRWSKLTVEHPQIIRRVQQGVQELQTSGFFHTDPQTGQEVFGIAGAPWMRELTGALGFSMEGPVKGLNIVGQGTPGVGLTPQIAAALVVPKIPATVAMRNFISPYGSPDFSGGIEMLFPGWYQKLQAGEFRGLGPIGGVLRTLTPQTSAQKITVQDLAKQAYTTMAFSGAYDMSNPDVQQKMWDQAMSQAERLYMWRGLAQFALPTAPTYSASVVPKDGPAMGTSIFLYKIGSDYRTMLKADGSDSEKATLQLVQKYGPNAIYATEPDNLRTVYGVPTTVQGEQWQQDHHAFTQKYGNVWGYFAPQGGAFSQVVYHDELNKGLIQPLTVAQWAQEADQHIGSLIYDQLRKQVGASPNKAEREWLATNKAAIAKQYPGYGASIAGVAGKPYSTQRITEITNAVNDPAVSQTPLAQAAKTYIEMRQQALTASGMKSFTSPKMAPYRAWLYENGTKLATVAPAFSNMWDALFMNEVAPDA